MIEKISEVLEYDEVKLIEYLAPNLSIGFINRGILECCLFYDPKEGMDFHIYCPDYSVGYRILNNIEEEKLRILILTGETVEQICDKAQAMYKKESHDYNLWVDVHNNLAQSLHRYFDLPEEEMNRFFRFKYRGEKHRSYQEGYENRRKYYEYKYCIKEGIISFVYHAIFKPIVGKKICSNSGFYSISDMPTSSDFDVICKKSKEIMNNHKEIWDNPIPNFLIAKEWEYPVLTDICVQINDVIVNQIKDFKGVDLSGVYAIAIYMR